MSAPRFRLGASLALSVALHGALLAGWGARRSSSPLEARGPPGPPSTATRVTLWAGPARGEATASRDTPAATGEPREKAPPRGELAVKRAEAPLAAAAPATNALGADDVESPLDSRGEAKSAAAGDPEGAGLGNEAGTATGPISRGGNGSAGVPGVPADGASPAPLAELHRRLAVSARECYPEGARRFGLRGEVELSFCLEAGALRSVELRGTTRAPVLDKAARECVVQGALPLPVSEGCFRVPVQFR